MTDLTGRTALVTGGGRGIGRAVALALAGSGADVAITYASGEAAANETAAAIRDLGRRTGVYRVDVADFAQCEAMAAQVIADLGPVGILVNNAGIYSSGAGVVETDPAELERVIAVDTYGSFYVSKLFVPTMRELDRGDIVMISSTCAQSFDAGSAPYNMAKFALEAVAYTLAKEERQHGIHANVVAPGLVETDMGRALARARGIADMRELDERTPFGRVCQPEDVAEAVLYLVGDGGRFVTNQRVTVSAGPGF